MSLVHFFSPDEISKIKICHMVAKDHPGVIEGRRRLIAVDVLDYEEAAGDASIVHDDAAEIEEDGSGLVGGGCYRRGARYSEGFEVFLSLVLHIETFYFNHTWI